MSGQDGVWHVAALAALLVPDRASRLVALLAPPHGARASARLALLAALPRRDRVAALSSALGGASPEMSRAGATVAEILTARLWRDAATLAMGPVPRERVRVPVQAHPADHDLGAPWHVP